MKRRHLHEVGPLTLAEAALQSLPDTVQQVVRSAARFVPASDRHDLISIAWLVSQTCDSTEHLHQELCSEARRMRIHCVGAGSRPGEYVDVPDICDSTNDRGVLQPDAPAEMVELRDPEWCALAGEASENYCVGVNDLESVHSSGFSESILHAPSLARRMGISVRHARRYIARWRQQDALAGDD